jgi:hypothetical protein
MKERVELITSPAGVELYKMGYTFGAYGRESDRYVENSPNKFTVDKKDVVENWARKGEFDVANLKSVKFIND